MIPSVISPEVKSNAERRIFSWFKHGRGTENWVVLHSLGIANHNKVIHGEIDFFVLAPGFGLFALEVKGGSVSRKEGVWQFTNRYGKTGRKTRGPFDQAWDGVHSIVRDIKSKLDYNHRQLNNLFFGIGVMFPDIEYTVSGSDEQQWQVFDTNNKENVCNYIKTLSEKSVEKYNETFPFPVLPTQMLTVDDVNYITTLLRGDFDHAVALGVLIKNAETSMITLTEEQYRCTDQLEDNPRCLIRGGAGTGKTLIAVHEAMRAVASGKQVAMFCFNNNLGRWLATCFAEPSLRPRYVGTLHKFLTDVLKSSQIGFTCPRDEDNQQHFYRETLPSLALSVLKKSLENFDMIIIDEAHDLINEKYLDIFDVSLSGGLTRGIWKMFGDFSMQAIYSAGLTSKAMLEMLDTRTAYIKFRLTVNCRNTKPICEEICTVTGYTPPSEIWMKIDGPPVNYITYSGDGEGGQKLQQIIENLMVNGISSDRITILSPEKRESSIVRHIHKYKIADYRHGVNKTINFCTIQSFKGLENTVIILVDISTFTNEQLMYVAFSRAKASLYVIESKNAAKEYLSLQQRRFLK
jgi:ATP:corrinoid adenosyltransferase